MNYKFQVVSLDKKGYIERFKDFDWRDIDEMLVYLNMEVTNGNVAKVEITRWNKTTRERE